MFSTILCLAKTKLRQRPQIEKGVRGQHSNAFSKAAPYDGTLQQSAHSILTAALAAAPCKHPEVRTPIAPLSGENCIECPLSITIPNISKYLSKMLRFCASRWESWGQCTCSTLIASFHASRVLSKTDTTLLKRQRTNTLSGVHKLYQLPHTPKALMTHLFTSRSYHLHILHTSSSPKQCTE